MCHVERDAYAAATLVARMEDAQLAPAPVWDDLTTFDGKPLRGKVDLVTAGLPCQPYSTAGKRRGNADDRALWPNFIRVVEEVEPSVVFLENVPPFLKHFEAAFERLLDLGFQFAAPFRASAVGVGAPHRRRRVFILAAHPERFVLRDQSRWGSRSRWHDAALALNAVQAASDADGNGRKGERRGWILDGKRQTLRHDAHGCRAGECPIRAPWSAESPVLRVDDGPASRVDQLRVIGNAVMPEMARVAFIHLFSQVLASTSR